MDLRIIYGGLIPPNDISLGNNNVNIGSNSNDQLDIHSP